MYFPHLLRVLVYLTESETKQKWSKDVADLLRKAIHERNARPNYVVGKISWLDRLDRLLEVNLLHLKTNFEGYRKELAKCRDYIFNFLDHPAILPTDNNASERGIRKLKIKQKVFGIFRYNKGDDVFAIHSVAYTAWKNEQLQL